MHGLGELIYEVKHDYLDSFHSIRHVNAYLRGRCQAKLFVRAIERLIAVGADFAIEPESEQFSDSDAESGCCKEHFVLYISSELLNMVPEISGNFLFIHADMYDDDGPYSELPRDSELHKYGVGFRLELKLNHDILRFDVEDVDCSTEGMPDEMRPFFKKHLIKIHFWLTYNQCFGGEKSALDKDRGDDGDDDDDTLTLETDC